MPITHCVFFKRDAGVSDAAVIAVYEKLSAITDRLAGASNFRSGVNTSPENLGRGYADGFMIDFENAAQRDAYLVDDQHQKAGGELVSLCENGIEGIFVFDMAL